MKAFEEFLQYKTRVPVRGAIMLNVDMDSAVLVKGWKKSANWSFPRGKINKDEDDLDCAIREVYEETGFDIREAGLVPPKEDVKYIEVTMREQQMRLYVFRNVPMDTQFEPKTRKEISKIAWYRLSELPAFRKKGNLHTTDAAAAANANKFYMVAPFLVPLKKWVVQQKKRDANRAAKYAHIPSHLQEEVLTEEEVAIQTEDSSDPISRAPPPGDVSSAPPPAIDTIEGATMELHRLLKVQPRTQGLQPAAPPSNSPSAPRQDKGGALLAMLQRSAASSQPPPPDVPRHDQHTPLDSVYAYAPQPDTPQHHQPRGLPQVVDHQPPPPFPGLYPTQPQAPPPPNYYYHPAATVPQHMGTTVPPHPSSLQHPLHPAVPLMHPQPLPPQVQKTLLDRGMFPTPGVPETTTTVIHQAHIRQGSIEGLIYQHAQGGKPARPQPNSHAMSLLSAFKGDTPRHDRPSHAQAGPMPHHAAAAPSQQHPRATAGPDNRQNLLASFFGPSPAGNTSSHHQQATTGPAHPAAISSLPKPQAPTDQHRSSLLEMFKREIPESQRNNAVELDGGDSVSPALRQEYQRPTPKKPSQQGLSNGQAIEAAARLNGGPIRMNPDLNLPFGAFAILPRPKGGANLGAQAETSLPPQESAASIPMAAPYSPGAESTVTVKQSIPFHRAPPRVPPVSSRDQPSFESRVSQSHYSQSQHDHAQHGNGGGYQSFQAPHPSAFGAPPFQRPQDAHPGQQQKLLSLFAPQAENATPLQQQTLLSLFGKTQPEDMGGGKMEETPTMARQPSGQIQVQASRSRLASLGSAAGDVAQAAGSGGRRDSQTPISPADKNFLLGYLGSAFGGGAAAAPR